MVRSTRWMVHCKKKTKSVSSWWQVVRYSLMQKVMHLSLAKWKEEYQRILYTLTVRIILRYQQKQCSTNRMKITVHERVYKQEIRYIQIVYIIYYCSIFFFETRTRINHKYEMSQYIFFISTVNMNDTLVSRYIMSLDSYSSKIPIGC